jgi:hypothetical protein
MKRLLVLLLAIAPLVHADSRRNLYVFGGKSMTGRIGQADVEAVNFELGRATNSRFEFGTALAVMNIRQRKSGYDEQLGLGERNVAAAAASLFVRYHFGGGPRLRPFIELSSGPLYSQYRVPAGTSRINFYSQAGAGVTWNPTARVGIITGWRFGHISNGGIEADKNPGYNTNALVVGIQLRPMPR